ncbi:hypothetical protein BC835DRAFT_1220368, partial [Cytidiella melzeri]
SNVNSDDNLAEKPSASQVINEKEMEAKIEEKKKSSKHDKKRSCKLGLGYFVSSKKDVKKSGDGPTKRPMRSLAPIYGGLAAALSFYFIGSGISVMIVESVLDGGLTRFWLVTTPFLFCISLFFCAQLI